MLTEPIGIRRRLHPLRIDLVDFRRGRFASTERRLE
jgi:hypothetical protein